MPIEYPFIRGPSYSFADFLRFEEPLRIARRQDHELDVALGLSRERWMKLRNSELYPLLHFARLQGVEHTASFRICPEGAEADLELIDGGRIRRLQLTTAGPLWSAEERYWGRDYALHIEKLKREGEVRGSGPFRREQDGSISNREVAISTAERDPAYLAGLLEALRGKQHHRILDCELLVYAVGYCEMMSCATFLELAQTALASVPMAGFVSVHIIDAADGFIVSRR